MSLPLSGIRVCDLTRILAGPFATMKLADMGAEVIKVERPGCGDDTRTWGPPFIEEESCYFLAVNRNKKSLCLDLKSPNGKDVLTRLISTSDVVISNFRPGTMESLGFGPERVAEINPASVYVTISGYGDVPEEWGHSSYDVIVQGECGLMHLTGDPAGPPYKVGISIADEVAGMLAVEGILLALLKRHRTGQGDRVDIALLDGMLSLLTYQGQNTLATGRSAQRLGNEHPSIVPYQTFPTADGWINVGVGSEALWQKFCAVLGQPELAAEPLFRSNRDRVTNRAELIERLEVEFRRRPTVQWLDDLTEAGIPCGKINDVSQALEVDSVRQRGTLITVEHRQAGRIEMVGNPIRLAGAGPLPTQPPPLLGEHSEEILAQLGYSAEEIAGFRADGVL